MRWLLIVGLISFFLASCDTTASAMLTPAEVHARWVMAVRANDRTAALDLVSENRPEREQFVDEALNTLLDLQTAPHSPTGPLRGVDMREPQEQGGAQQAISVWHFAQKTWCYQTQLIPTPAGWRVVGWGQIAQCP